MLLPPRVILTAVPGDLGTMVLATPPVVYAESTFLPIGMKSLLAAYFPAVMTVTKLTANFSREIALTNPAKYN